MLSDLSRNPAIGVELPEDNAVKREVFTPAEVSILLSHADPEWATAIRIGYYTGQRLGDVLSLSWGQLNLAAGTVRFKQKKTSAEVLCPLHPELRDHLESIAGDNAGPVMPSLAKLGPGGRSGSSGQFQAIMEAAGIDRGVVQGGGTRKLATRSFHSLRHSFSSALMNAGVPEELRMRLTGHRSKIGRAHV